MEIMVLGVIICGLFLYVGFGRNYSNDESPKTLQDEHNRYLNDICKVCSSLGIDKLYHKDFQFANEYVIYVLDVQNRIVERQYVKKEGNKQTLVDKIAVLMSKDLFDSFMFKIKS